MATVSINLSDDRIAALERLAAGLGVTKEELVRASVEELLGADSKNFSSAAQYVLDKNAELYRRLSR